MESVTETSEFGPDFGTLARLEEITLASKLESVRAVIAHGGEKGRALEAAVLSLLRDFLPAEYGLSTGFVAYFEKDAVRLSPQLDIIVYDALRTGPLARLSSCDVFPLEAVYAYIEVKAVLSASNVEPPSKDSLEACLIQNQKLRGMLDRRYYSPAGSVYVKLEQPKPLAIRGYVVAFELGGALAHDPTALAQRMADQSARLGRPTHLHGVFVPDFGFFTTRPVPVALRAEMWHVDFVRAKHGLSAFRNSLLSALSRYPRFPADWTPMLARYFESPTWEHVTPEGVPPLSLEDIRALGTEPDRESDV